MVRGVLGQLEASPGGGAGDVEAGQAQSGSS
jgi:hypothetical protein